MVRFGARELVLTWGSSQAGQDTDAPEEEGANLPSAYCEIIVNDDILFKTRVKQCVPFNLFAPPRNLELIFPSQVLEHALLRGRYRAVRPRLQEHRRSRRRSW